MTFKEKYDSCNTWQEKAIVVNLCHWTLINKRRNQWNLRATASYLGISLGYVSESIKLANRIREVESCKSRKEALIKLR